MDTDRYRIFYEVCLEKSFSGAARKLSRTQPAISHSIQQLEEDLSVRLFRRCGRRIEITEAGKALLIYVKEALHLLDQGRMHLSGLKRLAHGRLIISASEVVATYLLPDIIGRFRKLHDGVEIKIQVSCAGDAIQHLLRHESDIALISEPFSHPLLTFEDLMNMEEVVIFPVGHPLADRKTVVFEDLLSFPMILPAAHEKFGEVSRRNFQNLTEDSVRPSIVLEFSSMETIKKMVQKGLGISIVPLLSVQGEISRKEIGMHYLFRSDPCNKIVLVYRIRGHASPAAHIFSRMVRKIRLNFNRRENA